MRYRRLISAVFLFVFVLLSGHVVHVALAEDDETGKVRGLNDEIAELKAKLDDIQGQKQSLSKTISFIGTKVQLTQAEINQTQSEIDKLEADIESLSGKIDVLNVNLEKLSQVLVNRIEASYKSSQREPTMLLFVQNGFTDFFRQYKYLKVSQQHDRDVIFALEEAKSNYDTQKTVKEEKQEEVAVLQARLVTQKNDLTAQKQQEEAALRVTQNNELRYQQQLDRAQAELNAIQSIIAGRGNESSAGEVREGDKIASVIPTASTCSNGAHLHFEVARDGVHQNPAQYLGEKSGINWDNGPDSPFGFSGSWPWPLSDPIRITQGYGMTFYAATLRYYGGAPHTGIDMISDNTTVRAVKNGTLYRGGISCAGGTLRYVRVAHDDGIDSYYLHVNY